MSDKTKKYIKELSPYVAIIIFVILLRTFIITPVIVNGYSMEPTLKNNEVMILKKFDKSYERFDIVVLNLDGEKLIKRIIGLPGETIKVENGDIYINGEIIEDNYGDGETYDFAEITIAKESYFVMGDNREDSKDSRYVGAIKKDDIYGKTNFIIFPFKSFGSVN